ncbi:MAG: hypothetical protein HKN41_09690, partial [Ilumatobacter sp.]|nr:hypothetical protein [Ilumatobacter sp.]
VRDEVVAAAATSAPASGTAAAEPASDLADDETTVMPEVADSTPVRWIDPAAPWLEEAGGDPLGKRLQPVLVARVLLRYDETKADLVHDEEFECVIPSIGETVDVGEAITVDYDERDLRDEAPEPAVYRMTDAKLTNKTFFSGVERDLKDHLVRSRTMEVPANKTLKLYGRPGETAEEFGIRCARAADEAADADIAKLRDKYESKVTKLRDQIEAAEDRVDVLEEQASSKRNSELLSTAGSILGGLLGGKSKGSMLGKLGTAAGRRGRTKASKERLDAAENKVERLEEQLEDLEVDLAEDVTEIETKWAEAASDVTALQVPLEKTDIKVSQLALAWMPVD